jgi:hypothetical protein
MKRDKSCTVSPHFLLCVLVVGGCASSPAQKEISSFEQRPMSADLIESLRKGKATSAGGPFAPLNRIIGKYASVPSLGYESLELRADGTFIYQSSDCFGDNPEQFGRWSVSDGQLLMQADSGRLPYAVGPTMVLVEFDNALAVANPEASAIKQCGYCEGLILMKVSEQASNRGAK